MTLDPTARRANVQDSLKKYFVDNLETIEGIALNFDRTLEAPALQGTSVDRWVAVNFDDMQRSSMSSFTVHLHCAARRDSEGFRLAQLTDTVYGYLKDSTQTDGMARIPLYRSRPDGAWTLLDGGIVIQDIIEGGGGTTTDLTKFITLSVRCRWGAKI